MKVVEIYKYGLIYAQGNVYVQRTSGSILGHWNRLLCKQGEEQDVLSQLASLIKGEED